MGLDALFVFLILTGVLLLSASRLRSGIRLTALQGAALSLLPFLARTAPGTLRAVWLALFGSADQLDRAQAVLAGVRGEPPFVSA